MIPPEKFHPDKRTAKMEPHFCLICKYRMDAAGSIDGEAVAPQNGDVSICLNCGALAIYGEDLKLREPTVDERFELLKDQDIVRHVEMIRRRGKFK